jgi:hypothetical protein
LGIGTATPANALQVVGAIRTTTLLAATSATLGATTTADVTSVLDAISTTKGVLLPRMTNAQRTAIATPTTGLLAYSTDTTEGMYVKLSGSWQRFLTTADGTGTGTVTSVAALTLGTTGTDLSSTVATGTTTPVITLQVPTASATNRGALSSTDWTTFNGKQNAITLTTTGSSGSATFVTNTLNVPTYTLAGLGGQPLATNLTSLSGLTYASTSFVKMTAAGTFSLDTNTYLTSIAIGTTIVSSNYGSILFTTGTSGSGVLSQDATNLSWDNTNKVLSIGPGGVANSNLSIRGKGSAGITYYLIGQNSAGTINLTLFDNGDILANSYIKSGGTSAQFLKADGSVDSTTYGSGTVTSVAALTLGTSGTDLSSTVATGTTTPVITLNVPTASATNRGALSSTDWSTFNGKQSAITLTTTGTSGAATLVGATLNIPQYTAGVNFYTTDGTLTSARTITAAGFGLTYSDNKNGAANFTVSNTTAGTASTVLFTAASDASAGNFQVGKYSSTKTAYKTLGASNSVIYNNVAGNISVLNDFASGNINFAAGGSTTAQLTLSSAGNLSQTVNQNASTSMTVSNTTAGTASSAAFISTSVNGSMSMGKVSSTYTTVGTVIQVNDAVISNSTNGDISIFNNVGTGRIKFASNAATTPQMILSETGNLLVGTTSDSTYKLDVTGQGRFTQGIVYTRLNPTTTTVASTATLTPDVSLGDLFTITAQAVGLSVANPTGTPVNGQKMIIRIEDNGTARAITWSGTQYRASTDLALPTTTIATKTMYLGFIYNSTDTKWDMIAFLNNF